MTASPCLLPPQHVCGQDAIETLGPQHVEASIGERFLVQSRRHSACLAVVDGGLRITYAELEIWARGIAARLAALDVSPGSRAVLLFDQGVTSIAATLGALLAGAAYVPVDLGEPDARLRALIDRVQPVVILTDDAGARRVRRLGSEQPVVLSAAARDHEHRALPQVHPGALACIHFTSGSTGLPKGVLDRHSNLIHNAMRYTVALDIRPMDRLSLIQAPASSATMSSMFAALLNGAALLPFSLDAGTVGALARWLRSERITIYHSVPAILRSALAFAGPLPDIRVVRLEGDRSYGQDMPTWRRHLRAGALIANGLGTTETGLCRQLITTVDQEADEGIMPVGHCVTDMEVDVVDATGDPLAMGAVGEIAVTSAYLASGYLDDDRATAAAFSVTPGRPGLRTYRTGDLGRLRPDGCLEYLGRRHGLSKVLGHRVEPAEVEAALATIPGVTAVAVRIEDVESIGGRVVAYLTCAAELEESSMRAEATVRLPAYMRPVRYVRLSEMPVGVNGKVDRGALPATRAAAVSRRAQPTDPLEVRVMAIARHALGRDIGRDDHVFLAGLDSLGAVDVLLALEQEVGRPLPPSLILGAPTVARLTEQLSAPSSLDRSILFPLATGGAGLPLVLVPGHRGHHFPYTILARHLAQARSVLASSVPAAVDATDLDEDLEALASRHVAALRTAHLDGPYILGGFCFGGALAYEMARQLIEVEAAPAGLVLLGVSPFDFPGLVPPGAEERWTRSMTPMGKLGRALRFFIGATTAAGRRHAADQLDRRGQTLHELASRDGRRRRRSRARKNASMPIARGRYHGPALELPVSLILPSWSLATYWADPRVLWERIGSTVDIHLVPGVERMMMREPVVASVARIMMRDPGASSTIRQVRLPLDTDHGHGAAQMRAER